MLVLGKSIWTLQPWWGPKSVFVWAVPLFTGLYVQLLSLKDFLLEIKIANLKAIKFSREFDFANLSQTREIHENIFP